jgi:hypothetical protein
MKIFLVALFLAAVIAFGAIDLFVVSGPASTPAASAGSADADTSLAAQTLVVAPSSGCYVPGDLIGDANPASIRCTFGGEP